MHPETPSGFLLQMPCRQVTSCIPAAITYLEDMYKNKELMLDDEDSNNEKESNKKLKLSENDLSKISELIIFAQNNNLNQQDSKTKEFIKIITEILENGEIRKVVIFSYFKRTLRYLESLLKERDFSIARIDGDVPFEEREHIIESFSKPEGYQILLLSEVGGEGLDMQFCNCIFNYDLPWNPMKIEQRIGRFDRYGQKSPKILIYNFSIEDTIESNIFLRLYNRIGIFERYVGELEPILGPDINKLTKEIFSTKLTQKQQEEIADKTAVAIKKKRLELESFDKERSKLIGQDNYFTEQISDIKNNEKFITPSEIINLISSFIDERFPKSKLSPSQKGKEIYKLKLDSGFQNFLMDYLQKKDHYSTSVDTFADLITKESFDITFDYKTANSNSFIEFVTFRHSLVKSIIDYYKREDVLKNTCCITWKDDSLEKGTNGEDYLFFIYLLDISASKKSYTLVPVVVDISFQEVDTKYSDKFFYILKNSKDLPKFPEIAPFYIDECEWVSKSYVISLGEQKESEMKEINESLINDQLSSLQQSYEKNVNRINEIIKRLSSNPDKNAEKIVRMRESEKNNKTRIFNKKKAELESKRAVVVGHELISVGYLNVRR